MKIDHIVGASTINIHDENRHNKAETRTKQQESAKDYSKSQYEDFDKADIEQAVDSLNGFIEPLNTNLKFIYHEKLEKYYVTVINVSTEEVIREIPPEKMLDMYAAMAESMGLLVDEKI